MAEQRETQGNPLYALLGLIIVISALSQALAGGSPALTPSPKADARAVCVDPCRYPFIEEPCNATGLLDVLLSDYRSCLDGGGKDYDGTP